MDTKFRRHLLRVNPAVKSRETMYSYQLAWLLAAGFLGIVMVTATLPMFATTSTETPSHSAPQIVILAATALIAAALACIALYECCAWGRDIEYYYKEVTQGVLVDAFEVDSESTLRYFFGRAKTIYRVQLEGKNRAGEVTTYTREVPETQWKVVYSRRKGQYFDLTGVPHG